MKIKVEIMIILIISLKLIEVRKKIKNSKRRIIKKAKNKILNIIDQ